MRLRSFLVYGVRVAVVVISHLLVDALVQFFVFPEADHLWVRECVAVVPSSDETSVLVADLNYFRAEAFVCDVLLLLVRQTGADLAHVTLHTILAVLVERQCADAFLVLPRAPGPIRLEPLATYAAPLAPALVFGCLSIWDAALRGAVRPLASRIPNANEVVF